MIKVLFCNIPPRPYHYSENLITFSPAGNQTVKKALEKLANEIYFSQWRFFFSFFGWWRGGGVAGLKSSTPLGHVCACVCVCVYVSVLACLQDKCARNLIPSLVLKPSGWTCNEHLQSTRSGRFTISRSHRLIFALSSGSLRLNHAFQRNRKIQIFTIPSRLQCRQTCHPILIRLQFCMTAVRIN